DLRVRLEGDPGAGALAFPHDLEIGDRRPPGETLAVNPAAALDLHLQPLGERVDHGHAHTVQAAGNLVPAVLTEFAAGVQRSQHGFHRGAPGLGMDAHGNAAAVVDDGQRAVLVDDDVDAVAIARHRLVDAVVDHLYEQVVQPARVGAADVHSRPPAHGFQAFEDLDLLGLVGLLEPFSLQSRKPPFPDSNPELL